jgi:hypothetical protein
LCKSLRELAQARAPEGSFCPSEASRAVRPADWRAWMDELRRVAASLIDAGELEATQGGEVVDIATVRGAIRLRLSRPTGPGGARLNDGNAARR